MNLHKIIPACIGDAQFKLVTALYMVVGQGLTGHRIGW